MRPADGAPISAEVAILPLPLLMPLLVALLPVSRGSIPRCARISATVDVAVRPEEGF